MSSLAKQVSFPREQVIEIDGIPLLDYQRIESNDKPIVLFLTGGGVLARIAYGHGEANPRDFLDYWLAERGWSLVAPSYPSDHDVFDQTAPDLTLADWARMLATLVEQVIPAPNSRPLVVAGWSMGGRAAFAVSRELRRRGIAIDCFASLSATPPFPRYLGSTPSPPERLTDDGLWDLDNIEPNGFRRETRWLAELAQIGQVEGHRIMSDEIFRRNYRSNVPPGLWGPELEPLFADRDPTDLSTDLRGASSFSGRDYPICVSIVPTASRDYTHALADEVTWGYVTIRGLINYLPDLRTESLPDDDWIRLREAIATCPSRLSRRVSGGHLFFVGSHGACATVDHLCELLTEATALKRSVHGLVNARP